MGLIHRFYFSNAAICSEHACETVLAGTGFHPQLSLIYLCIFSLRSLLSCLRCIVTILTGMFVLHS